MVIPHEEKYSHKNFYKEILDCIKHLRTFGEMRVLRSIDTVKFNLEDQVMTCMLLSYSQNHTGGTKSMLNIRTECIQLIQDII